MFRGQERGRLPSVRQVWFKSFSIQLILIFCLFILFATMIIFTRADRNINSLLDRALTITWSEYNQFARRSTTSLKLLADELETGLLADPRALTPVLARNEAFDLWFVADRDGEMLAGSSPDGLARLSPFAAVVDQVWQTGAPVASNELVTLAALRDYSPALADRAHLDGSDELSQQAGALFQVVAVPYRNQAHQLAGALVVAHLLNNDNSIAERLAVEIPDSFSTIGAGGIRVSGNLSSSVYPTLLGKAQVAEHMETIQRGERYYGRNKLSKDIDHLVVSDPIRSVKGEVIGALTIGHPSQGMASLKQDTAAYIILSALFSWGFVLAGTVLASRRWAEPIGRLATLAKRIDQDEVVSPAHLDLVEALPTPTTSELDDLQRCFTHMTLSLYEKGQEIQGYLRDLEARVEEKTLELRNAMTDLAASSNLKSKLLSNTSHELRTPLNSIIGFSEMLTGGIYGELTPAQSDRVQIIADSARYLLQLINDLLDVSLVQQGRMAIEKQPVDPVSLIHSVIVIIQNVADQKGIGIVTEVPGDLPTIYVDPTRIRQVLYNVLSNAVKFTPEGGTITLRTERCGEEIRFAVSDTGIGISERDQHYVFDEFYQAENTGYRKQDGFGLGLPLAKKLVELHGGRIELQSGLGQGTTITITLPVGLE